MIFKFNYYQKRKLLKIKLPLKGLNADFQLGDRGRGVKRISTSSQVEGHRTPV